MSHRLGEIKSSVLLSITVDVGFDEETGASTTSGTLEDITDLSVDVVVPTDIPDDAAIRAIMVVQGSTTGGSPATGAWAISIDGDDQTEVQRYLSGSNDTGVLAVMGSVSGKVPGTYTVKGRHRRVSGSSTVNSDLAQLSVQAVIE